MYHKFCPTDFALEFYGFVKSEFVFSGTMWAVPYGETEIGFRRFIYIKYSRYHGDTTISCGYYMYSSQL